MAIVWELTRAIPADELGTTEQLLSNGWQPFAIEQGRMWFRRAAPMDRMTEAIEGTKQEQELAYLITPVEDPPDATE